MIDVYISSSENLGLVWNADDWLKLRKNYRIVGELIGSLSKYPRQSSFNGLPLCLQPEEVTLLKEKGYAKLVCCPSLSAGPRDELRRTFQEKEIEFQESQRREYILKKENDVGRRYDSIVEGKRRKCRDFDTCKSDQKSLISTEVDKIQSVSSSNFLSCTEIADPWIGEDDKFKADWLYPTCKKEEIKYKIFKDLWEKGYYITSGVKFGGDFLCYSGDPSKFHADFIVLHQESETKLPVKDLATLGRIGSSTKKTVLLVTEIEGEISYQSLQWIDICE